MNISNLLNVAGVPDALHDAALACIEDADRRSDGLLWAKLRTRYLSLRASQIAALLKWEDNRVCLIRPEWANDDIAPVLNVTCNGDNFPWDAQNVPIENSWLNSDPASAEYQQAVAACYWCPGQHPRSQKARRAWYRRNGGEYRAWSLGIALTPGSSCEQWTGSASGALTATALRNGDAWLLKASQRLLGPLYLDTRVGYEVDNARNWQPIAGYQLRAPLTWSVLPRWGGA